MSVGNYIQRTSEDLLRVIRSIRLDLHEAQADFGRRFGVKQSCVARWETACSVPSLRSLFELLRLATSEEIPIIVEAIQAAGVSTDQVRLLQEAMRGVA